MRCAQSLKLNEARQVKYTIDMGSFVIVESSNKSFESFVYIPCFPKLWNSFYFRVDRKNKNIKRFHFKFAWQYHL